MNSNMLEIFHFYLITKKKTSFQVQNSSAKVRIRSLDYVTAAHVPIGTPRRRLRQMYFYP